jgi:hypothetical protein
MDVKTFLSIETCVFNFLYFFKLLQYSLNLANCSYLIKNKFLKIQNGQKFNMVDFLYKDSWYLDSGSAKWNVLNIEYVIFQILFYFKKFVARRDS